VIAVDIDEQRVDVHGNHVVPFTVQSAGYAMSEIAETNDNKAFRGHGTS
jgi:hypothetical protein